MRLFENYYDLTFEDIEYDNNTETPAHEVTARARTADGRNIVIDLNMYNYTEMSKKYNCFDGRPHWLLDQHMTVDNEQEEVTNKGDAFRILATLMKAIDTIYNSYNLVCYQTSYSGESKTKMFDRMSNRFSKKYNMMIEREKQDDMVYINLIDLQQAKYLLNDYQQLSKINE